MFGDVKYQLNQQMYNTLQDKIFADVTSILVFQFLSLQSLAKLRNLDASRKPRWEADQEPQFIYFLVLQPHQSKFLILTIIVLISLRIDLFVPYVR